MCVRERERERDRQSGGQGDRIIPHRADKIIVLFQHGKKRDYGTDNRNAFTSF